MNLSHLTIVLFLSVFVEQVCAETIYVAKENNFSAVPENVARAIREEKKQVYDVEIFNECKILFGKSVNLAKNVKGYIVSTNICGCGSATCPIWVVDTSNESPKVLISDGGVTVKIGDNAISLMPEIVIISASVGTCSEHVWVFDNNKYASSKWSTCSKNL